MNKLELTLGEILQLESEVNGKINPENGEPIYVGFLKQNISVMLKYELSDLSDFLKNEKSKVDKIRDELIMKYGEKKDTGEIMLSRFLQVPTDSPENFIPKLNPKYLQFDDEYGKLLTETKKEIVYPDITKDDLKNIGESKDDYQVLFKLIKKGTN